MNPTDITKAVIWEDGDATCMARIKVDGATTGFQSDISSVVRKVFDTEGSAPKTAEDTDSLTVATVVFDSLQTDGRWTEDATGYNFRDTVPASDVDQDHVYRVEYYFTTTGGSKFFLVYELSAQEAWSS